MVHKSTVNRSSPPGGLVGVIIRTTFRLLQIIIALIIAGLYGRDLQTDSEHGDHADSRWVYAEVVAGFSLLTAAVYLLPFIQSFKFFFWDAILFIFWTALFGVFGKMYIHRDCGDNGSCSRMKVGVWFDLVGMLLWFVGAAVGGHTFWQERHSGTRFSGRSPV